MLRENNTYWDRLKFISGRENTYANNPFLATNFLQNSMLFGKTVSKPQGYNYQGAILMSMSASMKISTIVRGEATMSVSAQYVYELASSIISGTSTLSSIGSIAEQAVATIQGEGTFNSYAITMEVLSAMLDAGARPSAFDIAQEMIYTQMEQGVTLQDTLRIILSVMAGKTTIVNLGGGNATVTFRDVNDTKDRVTASMTESERTDMDFDVS